MHRFELNYSAYCYISPGASASGGNIHSSGRLYASSNTEINGIHVSYGGGLYSNGTCVYFNSIVVSSGADFNAGASSRVRVENTTITSNASMSCYSGVNLSNMGFFNSIDNKFDAQPVLRFLTQSQQPSNLSYKERLDRWEKMVEVIIVSQHE